MLELTKNINNSTSSFNNQPGVIDFSKSYSKIHIEDFIITPDISALIFKNDLETLYFEHQLISSSTFNNCSIHIKEMYFNQCNFSNFNLSASNTLSVNNSKLKSKNNISSSNLLSSSSDKIKNFSFFPNNVDILYILHSNLYQLIRINNLVSLFIDKVNNLSYIDNQFTLKYLFVKNCPSLSKLPEFCPNLESLIIDNIGLINSIPSYPNLSELTIKHIYKPISIPSFDNLTKLSIIDTDIKTIPVSKSLQSLKIIDNIFITSIPSLPSLSSLYLSNTNVNFIHPLKNIKSFSVNISDVDIITFILKKFSPGSVSSIHSFNQSNFSVKKPNFNISLKLV